MTIDPTASRLAAQGVAFAPQIAQAARHHGLDPELLAAVAAQETGGPGANAGSNVIGDGGHGHGIFQIDDRSHAFAGTSAAMDPAANADYAAGMLQGLLKRFGGNTREALSAYNSGSPDAEGTVTKWADGQRLGYADSVMRHYGQLTGTAAGGAIEAPGSPPESILAEMQTLIGSIGSLASQAQSLPGTMPQLPQPAQPPAFHRASTDYGSLFDDGDDS